jgi:hypothetical protein
MLEFIGQILLMILGAIIPPIVTKRLGKIEALGDWRPSPEIWRISLMSTGISVFLSLFFIYLYDSGNLPFTRNASFQVMARDVRDFGGVYQNRSKSPMLVTISAVNAIDAFTMFAAVADDPSKFGQHSPQVASTSFPKSGHHEAMTFIVPRGYWYKVTTDGGNITPLAWTEYIL